MHLAFLTGRHVGKDIGNRMVGGDMGGTFKLHILAKVDPTNITGEIFISFSTHCHNNVCLEKW